MDNTYITAKEIAQIVPLSARHIAERVTHRKDFPLPYRIGKRRFWKRSVVLEWIEKRRES